MTPKGSEKIEVDQVLVSVGRRPVTADCGFAEAGIALSRRGFVAWVGMTEAEARAAGYDVVVHRGHFAGNGRAMIVGSTDGLVKVIAKRDGPLLGVHLAGPWASELLVESYLALNWQAMPRDVGASSTRTQACPRRSARRCSR